MDVLPWLLDSDPAIRWHVMRDLADAAPAAIGAERARVLHVGLGAAILAAQGDDGAWHRPDAHSWLPTLFTSLLLRSTGADPADPLVAAAAARLGAGFRWHESLGGKPFFDGETEPCINGGALAVGSYLGRPSAELAHRLLGEQLADGGWNCDAPSSTRSSYHSTICVLEGLLAYERAVGGEPAVAAVRRRGEQYLLDRELVRRRSTNALAFPELLQLAFPPRYHYDVLRGLDYLREAGFSPDQRLAAAVGMVEAKRQADGRWLLDASYREALAVAFDEVVGEPSRWITLCALRVLRWWQAAGLSSSSHT